MSWSRRFDEPIILPDGKRLLTLKDAIAWLAKEIPKSEHGMRQVQAAARMTEAADIKGPMIFARMGMIRAINRHRVNEFDIAQTSPLGETKAQKGPMTVWITCRVPSGLSDGLSPACDVR